MMYQKVLLAREYDLASKIMETTDPAEAKKYAGKEYFKSFSTVASVWDSIRKNVVKRGVRAKFTQNADLLNILLSTGSTLLAECSASDKLWGIGINLHDHAWHEVRNWNEKNYLGMILMELRDEFHKEINMFGSVQNVDYYDAESIDVWAMTAGDRFLRDETGSLRDISQITRKAVREITHHLYSYIFFAHP